MNSSTLNVVVIEFEDGYVAAASNECVTLTPDAGNAVTFISEAEALNFMVENAPGVLTWVGCVKFCRCSSSCVLSPGTRPTRTRLGVGSCSSGRPSGNL